QRTVRQYHHPGCDPRNRLELADEALGQVLIRAVETARTFHLDSQLVEMVDSFHHQPVLAGEVVILARDRLHVAREDIDALDDQHVIEPPVNTLHPNGRAAAATRFIGEADDVAGTESYHRPGCFF